MKKIFALVLAMAMVLSLGTALAATWGDPNANTTAAANVTIEVTKYVVLKDAANTPYFSKLDDAAIVKADDDVAFQIKITVPSAAALNTQFGTTCFAAGDIIEVSVDGTNLKAGLDQKFNGLVITLTDAAQTKYVSKTDATATAGVIAGTSMYVDKALEYGAVDMKVCVRFQSELGEITMKNADGKKFYVSADEDTYTVTSSNYRTNCSVVFVINGSDKVTGINVIVDGTTMNVAKIDGVYQCATGTDAEKFAGNDFLNMVLSVLGFSAADAIGSGAIYMTDTIWAQNFGVYFKNCNTASYAAYTPVPVVVTPSTTIPKTGSNASVIGFAMVAMAVVAAAVVAVKKVRA